MPIKIAFVLRYKDDMVDSGTTTVEEHNKIFRKSGKVWLGKLGTPIRFSTLQMSNKLEVEKFLILVKPRKSKRDDSPRIFIAKCSRSQHRRPKPNLIPTYYRNYLDVGTWFCLTTEIRPIRTIELRTWVVATSKQLLLVAVNKCPRTFFMATKKADSKRIESFLLNLKGAWAALKPSKKRDRLQINKDDYSDQEFGTDGFSPASEET